MKSSGNNSYVPNKLVSANLSLSLFVIVNISIWPAETTGIIFSSCLSRFECQSSPYLSMLNMLNVLPLVRAIPIRAASECAAANVLLRSWDDPIWKKEGDKGSAPPRSASSCKKDCLDFLSAGVLLGASLCLWDLVFMLVESQSKRHTPKKTNHNMKMEEQKSGQTMSQAYTVTITLLQIR